MYKSLDTTLHYNFRDNFLSHYTTGQKYIMYYYELGAFIGDSIPLTLSLLTAYNAFQVNAAINKLLNPRENGSSVVFDRNLVSEMVPVRWTVLKRT
jgi:hypothetical protein